MGFFNSSTGGGGGGTPPSTDPRIGNQPYSISDTNSVPPKARQNEFIADKHSFDTDGFPLEISGTDLTNWGDNTDTGEFTPISGATITLEEDADGYRYLDATGSADGIQAEIEIRDRSPFTIILVCEPNNLVADSTLIYGWNSSGSDRIGLKVDSNIELVSELVNEFGTTNSTTGVYGAEAVPLEGEKFIFVYGHTGEKVYFGSMQAGGAFRFANMEDANDSGRRYIDRISIGCRGVGTPDRFSQLKIYQVYITDGNLFNPYAHINTLAELHGLQPARPSTKTGVIPSHAFWFSDNQTDHPDVRGSEFSMVTSGTLSSTGAGITVSDTAVGGGSGNLTGVNTPSDLLVTTTDTVFTIAGRFRSPATFNAFDGLMGVSDGTNRHWEVSQQSSGRIWMEVWDSVGAKNINPTNAAIVNDWWWFWMYIDKYNNEFSCTIDDLAWETPVALVGEPSISAAEFAVLRRDTSGGARYAGYNHTAWIFRQQKLTQKARQTFMSTGGYWHGGKPPERVPL